MIKGKPIRKKGKLQFSKYFQNLQEGDYVSVIREKSLQARFPKRLQGKTGIIRGKRGKVYIVKVKDGNKEKKFLIEPIHLKKIKPI
jgi:large subunit ribosomal protein L21e